MRRRLRRGSALPIARWEASFQSINWIPISEPKKWKTFLGALPTASIADASLEDLPPNPCCRRLLGGGCSPLRRALEQPRRERGVRFSLARLSGARDFCSSRTQSAARRSGLD